MSARKSKQPIGGELKQWFEVVAEGCPRLQIQATTPEEAIVEYKSRLRIQSPAIQPRVTLME